MINAVGTNQKRILSLSNLKHNLINDPDLASVPPELLPRYSDTICSHWLRLHLIFQWIWKNFLHEMLFSTCGIYNRWRKIHRQFCIRDGKGFLSFLRLVGTSYIKKYASAAMVNSCCAHNCTTRDTKETREAGITFYRIPAKEPKRTLWLNAIGRKKLQPEAAHGYLQPALRRR